MKATTKQVLVGTAWLAILLAVIGGTILWQHQVRRPRHNVPSLTVTSTERIPILLLLESKLDDEQQRQLIATMQRNNGSQTVITVRVLKNGAIHFSGHIRDSDNRPYLNLELPRGLSMAKKTQLLKVAIAAAKKNCRFTQYNLICYGSGGLTAAHYLEHTTPDLAPDHLITIATAFNGTSQQHNSQQTTPVAPAHRSQALTQLIKNRQMIMAKTRVLLIAGQAKGQDNGDGVVPIQSALAGQSVFQPIVNDYRQAVIHSWRAGHTNIVTSWKMGNAIQDFIN